MIPVRQSTAFECAIGPVLDADGVAVTNCVVGDFKIKKTTGNFAALNGSATLTHVSAGFYDLVGTTSDTDTVGLACIAIDDTTNGCAPLYLQVVEEAVYDLLYAASATGAVSIAAGGLTAASLDATVQARLGIKGNGTAQSAAAGNIVVAAGTGSLYKAGDLIAATGSTQGYAQTRSVSGVSTDTLSVSPNWDVTPSGTITYVGFNGAPASETVLPGVNVEQINGVALTGDGDGSPFDVA